MSCESLLIKGNHLENFFKFGGSITYQVFLSGSHFAPSALTWSFSPKGQLRLIRMLFPYTQVVKIRLGWAKNCLQPPRWHPAFPTQYGANRVFRMGAVSLRVERPSGLSGTTHRLAQPLILNRYPSEFHPWTSQEDSCLRLHLLCALAPNQNVVEMVDCGLRLAASYASLMPPQNPIDLWSRAKSEKTKKPLSLTPVEKHPLAEDATPVGVGIRLNGYLASVSTPSKRIAS